MARVEVNGATLGAFLQADPAMQRALRITADAVMAQAEQNTPIGTSVQFGPFRKKGRTVWSHGHNYYKKLFSVSSYRGGFRVWNNGAFFHLLEWGSIHNPAYSPMRRAARSSNLRYKPNPNSRGA